MTEFLLILEIIGTVAFAVSGAMTGLSKKMDIFGVVILGLTTAVGGGALRDVILGLTPPAMFTNPIYAAVAAVVSVIVFLPAVRRWLTTYHRASDLVMLVMDSLGLGVFTVVGIQRAYTATDHRGFFLLVFVGSLQACFKSERLSVCQLLKIRIVGHVLAVFVLIPAAGASYDEIFYDIGVVVE